MDRPLYIILRNDLLGMTPGRAAAQASHGTSIFHEAMANTNHFNSSNPTFSHMISSYKNWRDEAGDFGTTIVLQAPYEEISKLETQFLNIKDKNKDKFGGFVRLICDPEYCYKGPGEIFKATYVITGLVAFLPEGGPVPEFEEVFEEISKLGLY